MPPFLSGWVIMTACRLPNQMTQILSGSSNGLWRGYQGSCSGSWHYRGVAGVPGYRWRLTCAVFRGHAISMLRSVVTGTSADLSVGWCPLVITRTRTNYRFIQPSHWQLRLVAALAQAHVPNPTTSYLAVCSTDFVAFAPGPSIGNLIFVIFVSQIFRTVSPYRASLLTL